MKKDILITLQQKQMSKIIIYSFILLFFNTLSCTSQTNTKVMEKEKNSNPLLCNPEKGMCEIENTEATNSIENKSSFQKPIRIIYFTDPICSSCWGIEPQIRKLKLDYGEFFEIEYHMGGLLPSWNGFNGGGISKPSDVAHHWDEVSRYYEMPIDGDVWLEDPLSSSYPPSIAFIAAKIQNEEKAVLFLRRIREMVFIEKKNITKWEYLEKVAKDVHLDPIQFKKDYEGKANEFFQEDLTFAKKLGVRGFPTIYLVDSLNNQEIIYGFSPYEKFENSILKLHPKAIKKRNELSVENLFDTYPTLTIKEISVITQQPIQTINNQLNELLLKNKIKEIKTKNGSLWMSNKQ